MQHVTSICPFRLDIALRAEERERLDMEAQKHGISRAEVLRRACPQVFSETGVRAGRAAGVSPWKLNQS
jgi:hypothetical protein